MPCVFLSYNSQHKGFHCMDPNSPRIYIAHHVQFDEECLPFSSTVASRAAYDLEYSSFLDSISPASPIPDPGSSPTYVPVSRTFPCTTCALEEVTLSFASVPQVHIDPEVHVEPQHLLFILLDQPRLRLLALLQFCILIPCALELNIEYSSADILLIWLMLLTVLRFLPYMLLQNLVALNMLPSNGC